MLQDFAAATHGQPFRAKAHPVRGTPRHIANYLAEVCAAPAVRHSSRPGLQRLSASAGRKRFAPLRARMVSGSWPRESGPHALQQQLGYNKRLSDSLWTALAAAASPTLGARPAWPSLALPLTHAAASDALQQPLPMPHAQRQPASGLCGRLVVLSSCLAKTGGNFLCHTRLASATGKRQRRKPATITTSFAFARQRYGSGGGFAQRNISLSGSRIADLAVANSCSSLSTWLLRWLAAYRR